MPKINDDYLNTTAWDNIEGTALVCNYKTKS